MVLLEPRPGRAGAPSTRGGIRATTFTHARETPLKPLSKWPLVRPFGRFRYFIDPPFRAGQSRVIRPPMTPGEHEMPDSVNRGKSIQGTGDFKPHHDSRQFFRIRPRETPCSLGAGPTLSSKVLDGNGCNVSRHHVHRSRAITVGRLAASGHIRQE